MSTPVIHVTQGYNEPAFYPMCPGSGRIARAIDATFLTPSLLGALQSIGVDVVADGEPAPDFTSIDQGRGLVHVSEILSLDLRNDTPEDRQ